MQSSAGFRECSESRQSARPRVLRRSVSKNWDEDEGEEPEADSEPGALRKGLGNVHGDYQSEDDIHQWNEEQNQPPFGPTSDLAD